MRPEMYTDKEVVSAFKRWEYGEVDVFIDLHKRDKVDISVNGAKVHALFFPVEESHHYYRWDCINGFTGKVAYQTVEYEECLK